MVGQVAKRQAITNPDRTISSIKRHMGSDYKVTIDGKSYSPQEISAMILQKLKNRCGRLPGRDRYRSCYHCPCIFYRRSASGNKRRRPDRRPGCQTYYQRTDSRSTGLTAWIKQGDQKVMVYDLGGGTFDVSIIEMGEGVQEVLATAGNNHLAATTLTSVLSTGWPMSSRKRTASTCAMTVWLCSV